MSQDSNSEKHQILNELFVSSSENSGEPCYNAASNQHSPTDVIIFSENDHDESEKVLFKIKQNEDGGSKYATIEEKPCELVHTKETGVNNESSRSQKHDDPSAMLCQTNEESIDLYSDILDSCDTNSEAKLNNNKALKTDVNGKGNSLTSKECILQNESTLTVNCTGLNSDVLNDGVCKNDSSADHLSVNIWPSLDLYTDLVCDDVEKRDLSNEEIRLRFAEAQNYISFLHEKLDKLSKNNEKLVEENAVLKKNISSLFLTAKTELKRKTTHISSLRKLNHPEVVKALAKKRNSGFTANSHLKYTDVASQTSEVDCNATSEESHKGFNSKLSSATTSYSTDAYRKESYKQMESDTSRNGKFKKRKYDSDSYQSEKKQKLSSEGYLNKNVTDKCHGSSKKGRFSSDIVDLRQKLASKQSDKSEKYSDSNKKDKYTPDHGNRKRNPRDSRKPDKQFDNNEREEKMNSNKDTNHKSRKHDDDKRKKDNDFHSDKHRSKDSDKKCKSRRHDHNSEDKSDFTDKSPPRNHRKKHSSSSEKKHPHGSPKHSSDIMPKENIQTNVASKSKMSSVSKDKHNGESAIDDVSCVGNQVKTQPVSEQNLPEPVIENDKYIWSFSDTIISEDDGRQVQSSDNISENQTESEKHSSAKQETGTNSSPKQIECSAEKLSESEAEEDKGEKPKGSLYGMYEVITNEKSKENTPLSQSNFKLHIWQRSNSDRRLFLKCIQNIAQNLSDVKDNEFTRAAYFCAKSRHRSGDSNTANSDVSYLQSRMKTQPVFEENHENVNETEFNLGDMIVIDEILSSEVNSYEISSFNQHSEGEDSITDKGKDFRHLSETPSHNVCDTDQRKTVNHQDDKCDVEEQNDSQKAISEEEKCFDNLASLLLSLSKCNNDTVHCEKSNHLPPTLPKEDILHDAVDSSVSDSLNRKDDNVELYSLPSTHGKQARKKVLCANATPPKDSVKTTEICNQSCQENNTEKSIKTLPEITNLTDRASNISKSNPNKIQTDNKSKLKENNNKTVKRKLTTKKKNDKNYVSDDISLQSSVCDGHEQLEEKLTKEHVSSANNKETVTEKNAVRKEIENVSATENSLSVIVSIPKSIIVDSELDFPDKNLIEAVYSKLSHPSSDIDDKMLGKSTEEENCKLLDKELLKIDNEHHACFNEVTTNGCTSVSKNKCKFKKVSLEKEPVYVLHRIDHISQEVKSWKPKLEKLRNSKPSTWDMSDNNSFSTVQKTKQTTSTPVSIPNNFTSNGQSERLTHLTLNESAIVSHSFTSGPSTSYEVYDCAVSGEEKSAQEIVKEQNNDYNDHKNVNISGNEMCRCEASTPPKLLSLAAFKTEPILPDYGPSSDSTNTLSDHKNKIEHVTLEGNDSSFKHQSFTNIPELGTTDTSEAYPSDEIKLNHKKTVDRSMALTDLEFNDVVNSSNSQEQFLSDAASDSSSVSEQIIQIYLAHSDSSSSVHNEDPFDETSSFEEKGLASSYNETLTNMHSIDNKLYEQMDKDEHCPPFALAKCEQNANETTHCEKTVSDIREQQQSVSSDRENNLNSCKDSNQETNVIENNKDADPLDITETDNTSARTRLYIKMKNLKENIHSQTSVENEGSLNNNVNKTDCTAGEKNCKISKTHGFPNDSAESQRTDVDEIEQNCFPSCHNVNLHNECNKVNKTEHSLFPDNLSVSTETQAVSNEMVIKQSTPDMMKKQYVGEMMNKPSTSEEINKQTPDESMNKQFICDIKKPTISETKIQQILGKEISKQATVTGGNGDKPSDNSDSSDQDISSSDDLNSSSDSESCSDEDHSVKSSEISKAVKCMSALFGSSHTDEDNVTKTPLQPETSTVGSHVANETRESEENVSRSLVKHYTENATDKPVTNSKNVKFTSGENRIDYACISADSHMQLDHDDKDNCVNEDEKLKDSRILEEGEIESESLNDSNFSICQDENKSVTSKMSNASDSSTGQQKGNRKGTKLSRDLYRTQATETQIKPDQASSNSKTFTSVKEYKIPRKNPGSINKRTSSDQDTPNQPAKRKRNDTGPLFRKSKAMAEFKHSYCKPRKALSPQKQHSDSLSNAKERTVTSPQRKDKHRPRSSPPHDRVEIKAVGRESNDDNVTRNTYIRSRTPPNNQRREQWNSGHEKTRRRRNSEGDTYRRNRSPTPPRRHSSNDHKLESESSNRGCFRRTELRTPSPKCFDQKEKSHKTLQKTCDREKCPRPVKRRSAERSVQDVNERKKSSKSGDRAKLMESDFDSKQYRGIRSHSPVASTSKASSGRFRSGR